MTDDYLYCLGKIQPRAMERNADQFANGLKANQWVSRAQSGFAEGCISRWQNWKHSNLLRPIIRRGAA